jgi:CRISPR-associated exonuclease Cas4
MFFLFFTALLLLLVSLALLWLARRTRTETGLPAGEVIYSDTGQWQLVDAPLISRRYGLVGKPDYLVQVQARGRTLTIPVEVKSRRRPTPVAEPHILQLAVYCLLVEEKFGATPPYGLLRYADATVKIPFTGPLRTQVLHIAEAIRRNQRAIDLPRNHTDATRCAHCGYRQGCGAQAL